MIRPFLQMILILQILQLDLQVMELLLFLQSHSGDHRRQSDAGEERHHEQQDSHHSVPRLDLGPHGEHIDKRPDDHTAAQHIKNVGDHLHQAVAFFHLQRLFTENQVLIFCFFSFGCHNAYSSTMVSVVSSDTTASGISSLAATSKLISFASSAKRITITPEVGLP